LSDSTVVIKGGQVTCKKSDSGDPDSAFIRRYFTAEGESLEDSLCLSTKYVTRTASITGADGEEVFRQENVEVPEGWSQLATNVVASKYFRGKPGEENRESSVKGMISRVVKQISTWGTEGGYFTYQEEKLTFEAEMAHVLLRQRATFNSPVWFNVGVEAEPQCSACFINSVDDTLSSILKLARTEGMIFKYGSGAGVNLSPLRGAKEGLSGGGSASGPVSFMKGFDAFAGVIKSGGKTRRAAKLICLDVDHPDVREFVTCKLAEEEKARALREAGYSGGIEGDAYASVFFQNANHSVRVSDAFMHAAVSGSYWDLKSRRDGENVETVNASELLDLIAETAWACGDPGIQFDEAVNFWHTCPGRGKINASNPCGEFVFLDNSACNLASLNLVKFEDSNGYFDSASFEHVVRLMTVAQEILVDNARYPTPEIESNSKRFRPLGLGYANLGALLMRRALPYDSEEARNYAAGITALMTATAYHASARLARRKGPFTGYDAREMKPVLLKHLDAIGKHRSVPGAWGELLKRAEETFSRALLIGDNYGFRNAQVTLLAPTGTIAFMMDCETTGVEPDLSLRKRKSLVGGGELIYSNGSLVRALDVLGYDSTEVELILEHLGERGTLVDSEVLPEHLPVFDCALPDAVGRSIPYQGHLKMLAAVQPFLSGAISKTVNLPVDTKVEDVRAVFVEAWEMGLKSITVYRDGSKDAQPVEAVGKTWEAPPPVKFSGREKLPETRASLTHKIDISGHEGYVIAGMYPDGRLGEVFVVMAKSGSTVSGLLDAWATAVSIGIQYGVPYAVLREKFSKTRFEPAGYSNRGLVTSILDYLFDWLEEWFPGGKRKFSRAEDGPPRELTEAARTLGDSGPPCPDCGSIMEPSGACHRCPVCGSSSGCG